MQRGEEFLKTFKGLFVKVFEMFNSCYVLYFIIAHYLVIAKIINNYIQKRPIHNYVSRLDVTSHPLCVSSVRCFLVTLIQMKLNVKVEFSFSSFFGSAQLGPIVIPFAYTDPNHCLSNSVEISSDNEAVPRISDVFAAFRGYDAAIL